jgi:glycosyltransferase involved in cell wall biosynthesis
MRLVTLVLHMENLELRKDTGQLPYHLGQLPGVETALVSYYHTSDTGVVPEPPEREAWGRDYPFLSTEVNGLEMTFLADTGRGQFYERSVLKYLQKQARQIDVLNLFHFNAENIFYTLWYKWLNPAGKVYIKLDINLTFYRRVPYFFNVSDYPRFKIGLFTRLLYPVFFRLVHTISAESAIGLTYFEERFGVPRRKMLLLPNGVDSQRILAQVQTVNAYPARENIILTVGKIGTAQKNNEMLLRALPLTDLEDWKVYFVGAVEPSFRQQIAQFYEAYPHFRDRVIFTGYIASPAELYALYNRARIFCMTSEEEGFPLSACEAAFFGNYLVLSDRVECFDELTDGGQFGQQVGYNDHTALAACLTGLLTEPGALEARCEPMMTYARERLTWQRIVPLLYERLNHPSR